MRKLLPILALAALTTGAVTASQPAVAQAVMVQWGYGGGIYAPPPPPPPPYWARPWHHHRWHAGPPPWAYAPPPRPWYGWR